MLLLFLFARVCVVVVLLASFSIYHESLTDSTIDAKQQERALLLKQMMLLESAQSLVDIDALDAPLRSAVQLHDAQTQFNGASLDAVPVAQRNMSPLDIVASAALHGNIMLLLFCVVYASLCWSCARFGSFCDDFAPAPSGTASTVALSASVANILPVTTTTTMSTTSATTPTAPSAASAAATTATTAALTTTGGGGGDLATHARRDAQVLLRVAQLQKQGSWVVRVAKVCEFNGLLFCIVVVCVFFCVFC